MNLRIHRAHRNKIILLAFWGLCIIAIYWFLDASHIPVRRLPLWIKQEVLQAGVFGPLIVLISYIVVTLIPFPTAALALISGTIYGPLSGSLLVLICINVASSISFFLGRYFGRHLFSEHEHGWVKKIDDLMKENGFMAVLVMRVLFVPFDVVSIGSGMSKISYREYIVASFLGSAPGTVTFVILGNAFTHPRSWFLFGGTLLISLLCAYALRRSEWAKKHLFKKITPAILE